MKKTIVWMCVLLATSFAAYAKSISVCFGSTSLEAKDDLAGLEAVPARNWMNVTSAGSAGTTPVTTVAATFKDDRGVTLTGMSLLVCSRGANYQNGATASQTERLIYGYLDDGDGTAAGFKVTGIPYSSYKVIIYRGTDIGNANPFGPHTINGTVYSYTNGSLTAGLSQGWGIAHKSKLIEGENTMVVGPLSGDLTVLTTRFSAACRACISGFQIVDLSVPDYQATVSADSNWSSLSWAPSVSDWSALAAGASAGLSVTSTATVTNDVPMNLYRTVVDSPAPLTLSSTNGLLHSVPFLSMNSGSAFISEGPFYSNVVVSLNATATVHKAAFRRMGGAGVAYVTGGSYDLPRGDSFPNIIGVNTPDSFTYYANATTTPHPSPKMVGDGTVTLQLEISNTTPMNTMVDFSQFMGTLRIVNTTYRARVNQGTVINSAWTLPAGATLWLSTNTQIFATSALTCNADIEFENGADPNHTWVDGNGAIGQLRLNAAATFNGALRIGTGTVRIGCDNTYTYTFNGPISGSTLELGAVGYGNNCVYNLNGNNSQTLTRIMDTGRNVLVKANTATSLGQSLSFVTNSTGASVITLSNGINVAVQTLSGTNANSTIAFASTTSQLSITGSGDSLYTGKFTGGGILSKAGSGSFDLRPALTEVYFADINPSLILTAGNLILSNATARIIRVGSFSMTGGNLCLSGQQQVSVTNLTCNGVNLTVDVTGIKPGTYTLIASPGFAFAADQFNSINYQNQTSGLTYTTVYTSGALKMTIGGIAWNGGTDGTWDTENEDWTSGGSGAIYADGNNVTFGDIADTAQATNTLDAILYPGSVTFDSTNTTWTLKTNPGETGTITNGEFIVTSGTVILADTNVLRSFTGTIKIYGGTLDATLSNSIPSTCTIQLFAPGVLRTSTYIPVAQMQNISGDLVFAGTSTNDWGAISTVGGARLIVESGILKGTHNDSFGSRNNLENIVIVQSSGAIDLNGFTRNANRWMTVTIEGTGWENSGAICNNTTTSPGDNSGIRNLILSGAATVNTALSRFDICREYAGTYVDFNGFTLTKTGTPDTYFRVSEVRNPGPVIISQGFLGICGFQIGDTTNMPITVQPGATLGNYLAGNIYSPLTFNSQVGGAVTNYANWRAYANTAAGDIAWKGSITLNPTAQLNYNFVNIGTVDQFQPGGYLTLGSVTANSGLRLPDGTTSFSKDIYTEVGDGHIDVGTNIVEITSALTGTSQLVLRGAGIPKWNGTASGHTSNLRLYASSGIKLQLMKDYDGPTIMLDTGTTLMSDGPSARAVPGKITVANANTVYLGDAVNTGLLTFGEISAITTYNQNYTLNSSVQVNKMTFGGWAAGFTVPSDVNLTFEEVNSTVNQGEFFIKNGLGRMTIKNATGAQSKRITLNTGILEFNNATGVAYTYIGNIIAALGTTLEKSGPDLITLSGTTSFDTLRVPAQETSGLAITGQFHCNRVQITNGGTLDTSKSYILLNGGTLRVYLPLTVEAPESWYAANSGANLTLTYRTGRPYTLTWNGGTANWSTSLASTDWLNGVTSTYFANNDAVRLGTQAGFPNATLTVVDNVTVPAMNIDGGGTTYTLDGTRSLFASNVHIADATTVTVNNASARFDTVNIGANSLLVAPASLLLNPPYRTGTLRISSDYAFANNANYTLGTLDVPAGTTFTYSGSVNNQTRPFAALRGAGIINITPTITDLDFSAGGGVSALFTGTLRVTGPYRSRVRGNLLTFATTMPAGSTIWAGNTMQLYTGGATYNANIIFEDGATLNSYFMDGNGIGNIRGDGNLTLNGTLNLGNGQIRVGGNTANAIYTFNGAVSGNFLQLDSSGYGNNCSFNLNANNSHTMTQLNDANENVTVNVNAAQGLGKNLSFVAGTGTSRVNIASNIAATVESVTSTDATTFINYNHASSSLTINSGSFMGVISGAGTLIKNSTGTLSLGNVNTWDGVVTLNAGTLELVHAQAITNAARLTCTDGSWVSGNPLAIGGSLTMPTNISGTASFKLYASNRDGVFTNDRIRFKTDFVISATAMKIGLFNADGSVYSVIGSNIVAQYEGTTAPSVATWSSAVAGATVSFTTNTVDKTIIMAWTPNQSIIDGTGYLWIKSTGDSWTTGANWSGAVAPPDSRATNVRFGNSITGAAAINNAASTIGTLSASASPYLYTLTGTVDLTNLWLGAGSRLTATLGGTEITCPSLQSVAGTLTIPASSILRVTVLTNELQTFGGVLNAASGSATLKKEGPGQLKVTQKNRPGETVVDGGTLELGATLGGTGAGMGTLTINNGGRVLGTASNPIGWNNERYSTITINPGGLFENSPYQTADCGFETIWHLTGGEIRSGSAINSTANASYISMYGTVYSYATNTPSLIRGRLVFRGDTSRADMPFVVADGTAPVDLDLQAGITIQNGTAIRLKKDGPGTLRMSAPSLFTAPLWVINGTLLMEESATFSCPTFQIDSPGTVYHNTLGSNRVFGKALMGTGTFNIGPTGSMTVTNAAAFTGFVRVDSGATLLASAYNLPGIYLNGGTFNLGGITQTALKLTAAASSVVNLTADNNGGCGKIAITGDGSSTDLSNLTLTFADPSLIDYQRTYTVMEIGSGTLTGLPSSNMERPNNLYVTSGGKKLIISPVSTLILLR
jgi:autotransporter-associated beta strand protein